MWNLADQHFINDMDPKLFLLTFTKKNFSFFAVLASHNFLPTTTTTVSFLSTLELKNVCGFVTMMIMMLIV